MTTDIIKYAGERVEAAIQDETSNAATPSFQATLGKPESTNYYGFVVPAEAQVDEVREQHLKDRRAKIDTYRRDADLLTSLLKGMGITPIATITAKAWFKIVKDTGLIGVAPSQHGNVHLNTSMIGRFREQSTKGTGTLVSLAFSVLVVAGITGALFLPEIVLDFVGVSIAIFSALALAVISTVAFYIVMCSIVEPRRFNRLVKNWLSKNSWDHIVRSVCTSGTDTTFPRDIPCLCSCDYERAYRIELPVPPANVMELVRRYHARTDKRAGELNTTQYPLLAIVAEPAALRFPEGIAKIFQAERSAQIEEERVRAADPILFVRQGTAVAVLAQYGGNLPLEKAAIDKLVNSEHLL